MASKECSMCKSKIAGSHYTVQLQSTHNLGTDEYVICNTCANSLKYILCGTVDPSSKPAPQIVMKSDNTLLTATGYIRVIRSVLEGNSLSEVSREYNVPIDVLRNALVPVYARMFDKAHMTDKELLAIRPVLPKKSHVSNFRFARGHRKDATKVQKLLDLGTWSADDICSNVRWKREEFTEFIEYYSNTSAGFNVMKRHILEMLENDNMSVESIAEYLGTKRDFVLDVIAGVDMARMTSIDEYKYKTVKQLYQLDKNTKEIAVAMGMPYRTVLMIINKFRHPNLKEIK